MLYYFVFVLSFNDMFCVVVVFGFINWYFILYVIGWKGEGKYNVIVVYFVKLYMIKCYLDDFLNGGEDDDLIVFGDGYDVVV